MSFKHNFTKIELPGCSSSVERSVWDREAGGPIPLTPTINMAGKESFTSENVRDFTKITDINSPILGDALKGFLSEGKPVVIRRRSSRVLSTPRKS